MSVCFRRRRCCHLSMSSSCTSTARGRGRMKASTWWPSGMGQSRLVSHPGAWIDKSTVQELQVLKPKDSEKEREKEREKKDGPPPAGPGQEGRTPPQSRSTSASACWWLTRNQEAERPARSVEEESQDYRPVWPPRSRHIPLLVALVFVVSDFLVLLALVFHLVESSSPSSHPLIQSSSSSSLSSFSPLSFPPCAHDRPATGTFVSIWILDSALLCCALLCRLIRTSYSTLLFHQRAKKSGRRTKAPPTSTASTTTTTTTTIDKQQQHGHHSLPARQWDQERYIGRHRTRKWDLIRKGIVGSSAERLVVESPPPKRRRTDAGYSSSGRTCLSWMCAFSQWNNNNNHHHLHHHHHHHRLYNNNNNKKNKNNGTIDQPIKQVAGYWSSRLAGLVTSVGGGGRPTNHLVVLVVVVLLLGSFSSIVVSSSPAPGSLSSRYPTVDSLNPWLVADGGLILRAVTTQGVSPNNLNISPLNWIRPNPGSCTPQPAIPACPSDRFCRLPETSRPSPNMLIDRNSPSTTTTTTTSSSTTPTQSTNQVVAIKSRLESESIRRFADGVGGSEAKSSQCLPYLQPSLSSGDGPSSAECICGHADGAKRIDTLRKYHLHHCYHYSLWHVLSDTMREGIAISQHQCYTYIEAIQKLDNLAAHFLCQFEDIIQRYDCGQTFSIKSTCHQCKIAYRQWVCSMVLPMWLDGDRIKPCRTFCHEVERLCPYFLPAEKTGPGSQYAGEPSFLCIDPDVRETTNQSINSAYSERSCYRPCTLDYNLEPDIDPSLCVASLGDMSGLVEEDGPTDATDRGDCLPNYTNETASDSLVDGESTDEDSDVSDGAYVEQCQSILSKDPPLNNRVSSGAWTSHLHFGWRWRTLVLPFALLPSVIHLYFT